MTTTSGRPATPGPPSPARLRPFDLAADRIARDAE